MQSLKASESILLIDYGTVILYNDVQSLNAEYLIFIILFLIITVVKFLQPSNIKLFIIFNLLDNITYFKLLQF